MDRYACFQDLARNEQNSSFVVRMRVGTSGIAVLAPHGGRIEPGTSEIASAIAGVEHSFYAFEGLKERNNQDLHITSTNFDEPTGLKAARQSECVVAIHGCSGTTAVVYVSGRDKELEARVRERLVEAGFQVGEPPSARQKGKHPENLCNRGRGSGLQLEVSAGLRSIMFRHAGERGDRTTPAFDRFIHAVRQALSDSRTDVP